MLYRNYHVSLIIAFVLLLGGCAHDPDCQDSRLSMDEVFIENTSFSFDYQEENFGKVFPEYFISPGDVLDVLFHIKTDFNEEGYQFKLETDNKIVIKFTHTPELNEEQYIRPDGSISLPHIGEVKAAGKTVQTLKRELRQKYARILQNPEIHILVPEFSKRIEELKKDLHTAPRGLSRLVTVRPDGYVTFPMVGEINVRGRTVTDVNKQLNAGYIEIFRGLQVDLFLHKSAGSNVYVLGNVNKVGAYEITRPITILEALTLAEGFMPSSNLAEIVVLRRNDELKKLIATKVDVEEILDFECGSKAFFLKPFDIVYVPKTGLAEAAQVGKDLKDTMLFRGWGINLSPIGNVLDVSD